MKRPIIYLIAAVIAALVVLAIERPENPRVGSSGGEFFFPGFDTEKVSRVEVEQLMNGVELIREGEGWKVREAVTPMRKEIIKSEGREISETEYQGADKERVTSALGVFGGLEEGVVVSDNPEKQKFYQVDKTGVYVRVFDKDNKPIIDCVIGKNGPDFISSYIRRADENKVHLVHRTLSGFFSTRVDDWLEKKKDEPQK